MTKIVIGTKQAVMEEIEDRMKVAEVEEDSIINTKEETPNIRIKTRRKIDQR